MGQLGRWQQDGTWDAVTQFAGLLTAVKSSATAPMAERLGTLISTMGGLVSRVAEPDTMGLMNYLLDNQAVVLGLMQQLVTWQSNGTWQSLTDIIGLVKAAKDSISGPTVEHLSNLAQQGMVILSKFLDSGVLPGGLAVVDVMFQTFQEGFQEAELDPKRLTFGGMFRLMKDPDVQISLKTLFSVLKKMPKVLDTL
jgi:uncharacterized protein YjgD (DUF1641 family)